MIEPPRPSPEQLLEELQSVRARLEEAEDVIEAIREQRVDALVVGDGESAKIYTLQGADYPYRVMMENMSEGALTVTPTGTILHANTRFAELLRMPHEQVIGSSLVTTHLPRPDTKLPVAASEV